ncbi:unnamed protein product [Paramecium sonneborni]|uniref:Uncharacterized protein n=1 Tax=Paramecium sonneborni TaxID=65129 RepID=A0A8S1MAR9_9CILI|nr:unnamed protein product [Paramecium sonneborni]
MGCSLQKSSDRIPSNKRYSINTNTQETPDKKPSLEVFNPILRKVVQVPILVPASKSNIMKRRSTQMMTIGL